MLLFGIELEMNYAIYTTMKGNILFINKPYYSLKNNIHRLTTYLCLTKVDQ